MSEINLLAFGCVVSFIAGAGGYLYLRQSFAAEGSERNEVHEKVTSVDFQAEARSTEQDLRSVEGSR